MAKPRRNREFVALVRTSLCDQLASGRLTAASIAVEMAVSKRTLQRRLASEHTSFSDLLDEVRQEVALAALSKGDLNCKELSALLGYRHQSTFTRAVHRWTGKPPTALHG